jgi:hypothetical protein
LAISAAYITKSHSDVLPGSTVAAIQAVYSAMEPAIHGSRRRMV